MAALLTPDELRAHLPGYTIGDPQADSVIRLVAGWLLDASGLTELPPAPEPVDGAVPADPLWSAFLELAVLAVTNPELLSGRTVGPTSRQWTQAVAQRETILDRVRTRYRLGGSGAAFGCFPDAEPWPDPPMIAPPGPGPYLWGWR